MNKPDSNPTQPFRGLIAGYTDAIRVSDFKANIGFLFVMFMMLPILYNYTRFPSYLPIPFVLLPFLIVYACLFMVLLPRFPKRGRAKNFVVARNLTPADFDNVAEGGGRHRAVEAALRNNVGDSLVEDAVSPRRPSPVDRLRFHNHLSVVLRLAYQLIPGRARWGD